MAEHSLKKLTHLPELRYAAQGQEWPYLSSMYKAALKTI
jgi:hypothetical protein